MTRACFNDNTAIYTVAPGMTSNTLERHHPDFAACEFAAGLTAGLKATGFGCDIPSGATILGVEVLIEKSGTRNNNDCYDGEVRLYNGVTSSVIGSDKSKPGSWYGLEEPVLYGGPEDTWGAALTPAILNHSGTGVVIRGWNAGEEEFFAVDWIKMKVYYVDGPAPGPEILFTGKDFDPDLELYYFKARWYDSGIGRFLSRAIWADPNAEHPYMFCEGNPIVLVDPSGKKWKFGGKCCNSCGRDLEWALVNGSWTPLPRGSCVGSWFGGPSNDCDGMTCDGGFYYVDDLTTADCAHTGRDDPPFDNRRWTPPDLGFGSGGGARAPGGEGGRGSREGDTPPGYDYGPPRR